MKAPVKVRLEQLLIGRARPFDPNGEPSAIDKRAVGQPLWLGQAGFSGDQQGDPRHHGGNEKAVHHYPAEHYAAWRRELPEAAQAALQPGGFGENLSTTGLTEASLRIGDQWRLGEALLGVSQPRKPCWKLNRRFGLPNMARRVQASGRVGWYYRVLQPGQVAPDALLELLERPHPDWRGCRRSCGVTEAIAKPWPRWLIWRPWHRPGAIPHVAASRAARSRRPSPG